MPSLLRMATFCPILLIIICSAATALFTDADKDGIRDQDDGCPGSRTDQVDNHGCSCAQKLAAGCSGSWCCNAGQYCLDAVCRTPYTGDEGYGAGAVSEFTFIVYGDTEKNEKSNEIHRRLVDKMVGMEPDMIFQTGDIVRFQSWDSHWETFFDIIKPITHRNIPYYVARGDSEAGGAWDEKMDWLPGNQHYYTITKENALFIVMDSNMDITPGSSQYRFVENALVNNDRDWVFVFMHHPLYNEGYHKYG